MPALAQGIFILTLNQADVIGNQSDAVTQNVWFRCLLCAAISGEISILIQTGAQSWGRFLVPRICRWERNLTPTYLKSYILRSSTVDTSKIYVKYCIKHILSGEFLIFFCFDPTYGAFCYFISSRSMLGPVEGIR